MNIAEQQLLRRYKQKIGTVDNSELLYQWSKQGVISNSRQFKMLFNRIVDNEIERREVKEIYERQKQWERE